MVTLCNRHGENKVITTLITIGWVILCFICHKLGWQQGVEDGAEASLEILNDHELISIDKKTYMISPGSGTSKTIKFIGQSIGKKA